MGEVNKTRLRTNPRKYKSLDDLFFNLASSSYKNDITGRRHRSISDSGGRQDKSPQSNGILNNKRKRLNSACLFKLLKYL